MQELVIILVLIVCIWLFRITQDSWTTNSRAHDKISSVQKSLKQKEDRIKLNRKLLKNRAKKIIDNHSESLRRQRIILTTKDAYGRIVEDKWRSEEIPYFLETQVFPHFNNQDWNVINEKFISDLNSLVDRVSRKRINTTSEYDPNMSGIEFEIFCLEIFRKEGWEISITKTSGDQGVDLIAEKDNIKIGIQCKKYSGPVGNKAVQEIKTGLEYYGLHRGIVVSNNRFTESAIKLANANKIELLHFSEISKIKGL